MRLWDTILSGKTWRGDFINRKKNGEDYWESASISPIINSDGEITHFVAVKQDITERKHMEKELIRARQAADDEIAAIPAEFAQDIAKRIRDEAEMGDVTTLNAIAEEIKTQSDSCVPLSKQIVQLAQDFDLDGIQTLADAFDAS